MEVSKCNQVDGEALLSIVVELTQLPESKVQAELKDLLNSMGLQADGLTLDQLRQVMVNYLEHINDVLSEDAAQTKDHSILTPLCQYS